MNANIIQIIITNGIIEYSNEMIIIVSSIIVIIIAFFVLKVCLSVLKDESFNLGGFYLRKTPYKGYNRFRSRKWNMEHTM